MVEKACSKGQGDTFGKERERKYMLLKLARSECYRRRRLGNAFSKAVDADTWPKTGGRGHLAEKRFQRSADADGRGRMFEEASFLRLDGNLGTGTGS